MQPPHLFEQLPVAVRERLRQHEPHARQLVAGAPAPNVGHAPSAQAEDLALARPRGDREGDRPAERGGLDRAAERRRPHRHVDRGGDVVAVAREDRVGLDLHAEVQVAAVPRACPADALAAADPRRDRDVERARGLPVGGGDRHRPLGAAERFFERDLDGALDVPGRRLLGLLRGLLLPEQLLEIDAPGAAPRPRAAAARAGAEDPLAEPAAAEPAEELLEELTELSRVAARVHAKRAAVPAAACARAGAAQDLFPPAAVLAQFQDLVVLRPALGVVQNLVRLVDLLEARLGVLLVAGVDVGMVLPRQLPERLADRLLVRVPRHAEYLVVVLELHRDRSRRRILPPASALLPVLVAYDRDLRRPQDVVV